jgi:hypothetical protein
MRCSTLNLGAQALSSLWQSGASPFNKVINEDWPGTFLIIVTHIIIDHGCEVKEKVPCVLRDAALVVLL